MSTAIRPVTTADETPMYIEAGDERLFAILTRPPGPARDLGVLILGGGGYMFSAQRNRLPVRMCRRFAAEGLPALRFDYVGTGDSGGPPPARYSLNDPFDQQGVAAAGALERAGVDRYVLVGNCFGARSALEVAPRLAGVAGVVLLVPPVGNMQSGEGSMTSYLGSGMSLRRFTWKGIRQVWRGVFRQRLVRKYLRKAVMGVRLAFRAGKTRIRKRFRRDSPWLWLSERFVAAMDDLARRRIPVLVVYGEGDPHLAHFRRAAASGPLADVLARAGDLFRLETIPGEVEGFASLEIQGAVLEVIHRWVVRRADAVGGPPPRDGRAPGG